jgi:squalene monooxygenase
MSAGPIALLGGLETNPLTLVLHFFAVAMFGVGRLMVGTRVWSLRVPGLGV